MIYYAIVPSVILGDYMDEARVEIIQEDGHWFVSTTGVRDPERQKPFLIGASGVKKIYTSPEEAKKDVEQLYGKLEWFKKT